MRKPTVCVTDQVQQKQSVQSQNYALDLESRGIVIHIHVAKTKALISFAVTAKLICAVVFAYADCLFSHVAAQLIIVSSLGEVRN